MAKIIEMENGFAHSVKDLNVYQKAYPLSLSIHRMSLEFPKIEQYALADQLRRSSKSICANLAEGFARQQQSKSEFKRFLVMAIGSCNETMIWLDYACDLGYIHPEQCRAWQEEYDSIYKMLIALRNRIKD